MDTMTLEQFRATGRDVDDLRDAIGSDAWDEPRPGRIYAGGHNLHIERMPADSADPYCLTIYNDSHSGQLPELEGELYDWALSEQILRAPAAEYWAKIQLDALTKEWEEYCERIGFECLSADEFVIINREKLTHEQTQMACAFISAWERAEVA